jgi:hypothetical protein
MTRGVLMFAHNNTEIDYLKIACANALMVKKNLNVPVTLVTDIDTLKWGRTSLGKELLDSCFEKVRVVPRDYKFNNSRNFSDTAFNTKPLQFYNCNHWTAYRFSPYDETLFIDCDYLIMSSALSNCWGSNYDVMINSNIYTPLNETNPFSKKVDELGITLYWATVIYFKKSSLAEHMFSLVKHIQSNYGYYRDLYGFSSGMFRNDNAFSIAVHTLNGFNTEEPSIQQLPIPGLLMSWDTDDIQDVNGINDITLYSEKTGKTGEYILTRLKGMDVHIMNKWAINRHADKLINLYKDDTCHADI